MSELTDFYIRNQKRFSSPNMDLSHRCILRCPQCLRQKVEVYLELKDHLILTKTNLEKYYLFMKIK